MALDPLFSIDLDEKIAKVTKNRFVEEYFFAIELIKTAVLRGARKIEVFSRGRVFQIRDDGSGIGAREILSLRYLFNRKLDLVKREAIIEGFIRKTGIGLLALFTPDYQRIDILNLQLLSEEKVSFEGTVCRYRERAGRFHPQTEIRMLLSAELKPKILQAIIAKYCSHIRQSVFINGRILPHKPLLRDSFIKLKLNREEDGFDGEIGIPLTENFCKIQLLHAQIPWTLKIADPREGLVFEAGIQAETECYDRIQAALTDKAYRLYRHLCRQYDRYPQVLRDRAEELVFNQVKKSGHTVLLEDFRVFRLTDGHAFTLNELKALLDKEPLFYIDREQKTKNLNTDHLVLSLTRKQADFLINYLDVGIRHYEEAEQIRHHFFRRMVSRIRQAVVFALHLFSRIQPVPPPSDAHQRFLEQYLQYLQSRGLYEKPVRLHFCAGRWGPPMRTRQAGEPEPEEIHLYLKKGHSLITAALAASKQNPEYLRLLDPFLPSLPVRMETET